MASIKETLYPLEQFAPKMYQESYDNSGLIVGDSSWDVSGVLVSLDCTEEVVDEAIRKNCNLIVSHHPIVFKGLKKFTGSNYVERTVIKAIKNDIALYAIHTNLDNVNLGVNYKIAEKLQLNKVRILNPKVQTLKKLTTYVPESHLETLANALHKAGAGQIGNYKDCSFRTEGTGTFTPTENTNPFSGSIDVKSFEKEIKLELIVPIDKEGSILRTLKEVHPYEEVAYYIHLVDNLNQEVGSGTFGLLDRPMEGVEFLNYLKARMNLKIIRHTKLCKDKIQKIAICGGSGGFLLNNAMALGADVFITADYKYHEFFDAENKIIIADIGHYESEFFTKDLISEVITKNIANIAVILSEINTNPINYF